MRAAVFQPKRGKDEMTFQRLTRTQLSSMRGGAPTQDYVNFLSSLKTGEGGRTTVQMAKVGRQTIKSRLKQTADHLGMNIKFLRSSAEEVVFEVTKTK